MDVRGLAQQLLPVAATRAALRVTGTRRAGHRLGVRDAFDDWVTMAHLDLLPRGVLAGPVTAVDVGAHVGEWTAALLRLPQVTRVVAVEPTPASVEALRARFGGDHRVRILPVAVGDHEGEVRLRLTSQANFNSVLPLVAGIDEVYGGVHETGTVTVPLSTLDAQLGDLDRITLLKIDVQGLESSVIAGATQTLTRVDCLQIEMNFRSHYDGDSRIWDLHPLLEARGFDLHRLAEPVHGPDGQVLWADAVYCRRVAG